MKKGLALLLMLLLFPALALSDFSPGDTAMVFTQSDRLNLRSEPGTHSTVLTRLLSGTQVVVLSRQGEWYQVESDAYTGYVHGDYLRLPILIGGSSIPDDPGCCLEGKIAYVSTFEGDLHLRSGPSADSGVLGSLPNASPVILLSQCGNWMEVKTLLGQGYVHCAYLSSAPDETPPPHYVLYSAPEEGAAALELAGGNAALRVLEKEALWSRVEILSSGKTGFIQTHLLSGQ